MYKLLLVDDEDIEREGMAQLIPWENYEIELVGTAWNGVEGYAKLQTLSPQIVITDIKMPAMNGIELIRKGILIAPDTIFVVLSGYGEYEFTSQAMELGVRHYILKPCDERKIMPVLEKVRAELAMKEAERKKENSYHRRVSQLLPWAKEQIFTNMLLKKEQINSDYHIFKEEFADDLYVGILAFQADKNLDYLEEFVLTNMLEELAGTDNLLLHAMIDQYVVYLLKEEAFESMELIVSRIRKESLRFVSEPLKAAVSRVGAFSQAALFYQEIRELFDMRLSGEFPLVLSSRFCQDSREELFLLDYSALKEAGEYGDILFECYLGLVKMRLSGYQAEKIREVYEQCLSILYEEPLELTSGGDEWELLVETVQVIAKNQDTDRNGEKENQRMQGVLLEVYKNIQNPKLSIQYLAQEVLYMNEDHLGRLFLRYRNEKYSTFLLRTRIQLAQKLIWFQPDMKISELASCVGYPPDGQYFAKAFKKYCSRSPSDYRESVKIKRASAADLS